MFHVKMFHVKPFFVFVISISVEYVAKLCYYKKCRLCCGAFTKHAQK